MWRILVNLLHIIMKEARAWNSYYDILHHTKHIVEKKIIWINHLHVMWFFSSGKETSCTLVVYSAKHLYIRGIMHMWLASWLSTITGLFDTTTLFMFVYKSYIIYRSKNDDFKWRHWIYIILVFVKKVKQKLSIILFTMRIKHLIYVSLIQITEYFQ